MTILTLGLWISIKASPRLHRRVFGKGHSIPEGSKNSGWYFIFILFYSICVLSDKVPEGPNDGEVQIWVLQIYLKGTNFRRLGNDRKNEKQKPNYRGEEVGTGTDLCVSFLEILLNVNYEVFFFF